MGLNAHLAFAIALLLAEFAAAPVHAFETGDDRFPYSIMAPEPGTATQRHATAPRHAPPRSTLPTESKVHVHASNRSYVRGSSGSVLPAPLPRTTLIPPEGGGTITIHPAPQQQGATIVPSVPGLGAVPNLPHSAETFQDRASRCAFQQGLNNVPGTAANQYMGACVQ